MSIGRIAGTLVVAALVSGVAQAQTPPPTATPAPAPAPAPAAKPVTLTGGMDVVSAYMFRGIRQEDTGFIGQPWVDLAVAAYSGEGKLSAVTLNFGNWDSLHSSDASGTYYESDYYASATFTAGKVKPGLLYTAYTSPADRFITVHELAGVFSVDDSANKVPLSPKIVLAFELDGQADAGSEKGVYLELGIKPALKAAPKLTFLVPVKLGLSLKDYYEQGGNTSDTFGYFDIGLLASIPLSSGKTSWEVHGGFDILSFGDNLKAFNNGDRAKAVGSVGISFTY